MDILKVLQDDLNNGFSKSQLERIIGLPKNCLSGVLKGDKKLSKKSVLKIEKWEKSEKPNPLGILPSSPGTLRIDALVNPGLIRDLKFHPANTDAAKNIEDKKTILEQIEAIRKEVIPKDRDTALGRKSWKLEQKKRIDELEKQLL